MKVPYILASTAFFGAASLAHSQNFPSSSTFFSPVAHASGQGDNLGLLTLRVTNALNTAPQTPAGPQTRWTHAAGGNIQAGLNTAGLVNLDAQLFADARTTGTSLVFGRQTLLEAKLILGLVDVTDQNATGLNNLLNTLVSASVAYQWDSTASVTGLNLQSGQTYRVSFRVDAAAGIPVDAITGASFGISSAGITTVGATTGTFINLLDLITIDAGGDSEIITYDFRADTNLSALDLRFRANSLAGVDLLSSTANDYLTISGLSVSPIPEPTAAALAAAGVAAFALRRRRRD